MFLLYKNGKGCKSINHRKYSQKEKNSGYTVLKKILSRSAMNISDMCIFESKDKEILQIIILKELKMLIEERFLSYVILC